MLPVADPPKNRTLVLHALRRVAEFEFERISDLRAQIHAQRQQKWKSFLKTARDWEGDPELAEVAANTRAELDSILELAEQMLGVATYRVVELTTVKILGWRWGPETVRRKELYKVDHLHAVLQTEMQADLSSVQDFSVADELRCLNNAIKHNGYVNAQLAAFPGWQLGEPIGDCGPTLERLSGPVGNYLSTLAQLIVPM